MRTIWIGIYLLIMLPFVLAETNADINESNVILNELPSEVEDKGELFTQKTWHLSIGNYFDLPSTYQVTSDGKMNQYELWPIANWGRTYSGALYSQSLLQWNIMLSLPKSVGSSDLTRTILSFDLLMGYQFSYLGSLMLGMSFFEQLLYFGETGEVQTEGSASSGHFYRPSRLVLVSQQTLTLAYRTPVIKNHYCIDAKSYIFSLWQEKERQESYALNLTYQW